MNASGYRSSVRRAAGPALRPVRSPAFSSVGSIVCVAVATIGTAITPAHAQTTLEWVNVGNAGNLAQPSSGYGAVNYDYAIGKYELTIQQYTDFLNATAKTDTYGLYASQMATDLAVAGILREGSSGSYTYSAIAPAGTTPAGANSAGNRPITYVSWLDAARFANWMHNGQGSGSTETGAYTLNGGTAFVAKNADALYWVPSEDEWFKAAFYNPVLGGTNYWLVPTTSNTSPGNTIGAAANQANWLTTGNIYSVTQTPTSAGLPANQNLLTNVGAYTATTSPYGTFDMAGNVQEWVSGTSSVARGFGWSNSGGQTNTYRQVIGAGTQTNVLGFRMGSVPQYVITSATEFDDPVRAIVTVNAGGDAEFNGGFSGNMTVNAGTATLAGAVAANISIASGGRGAISAGADLTGSRVSLAQGGILSVTPGPTGTDVPFAAGNISGLTVPGVSTGLASKILSGTVATDSTIFVDWNPIGDFDATGSENITGGVYTFSGTGSVTWVLQAEYDPLSLPGDPATLADAGELYLAWREPIANEWLNAVAGNTGGTAQFFSRAWEASDLLGSYGVDTSSNTVWAVVNHNSDFAVFAVPEPGAGGLALGCLAVGGGYSIWRRRRRA
jgi:sulfatase modifying factor 1